MAARLTEREVWSRWVWSGFQHQLVLILLFTEWRFLMLALFLLLTLSGPGLSLDAKGGSKLFYNLLSEPSLGKAECDLFAQKMIENERKVKVDDEPQLLGHWVSSKCETWSGPRYVLRSLTFSRDLSFHFHLYRYTDANCSSPLFSVAVKGTKNEPSSGWSVKSVTLVPSVSGGILDEVQQGCPHLTRRRYRAREKFVILHQDLRQPTCLRILQEYIPDFSLLTSRTRISDGVKIRELLYKDKDGIRLYGAPMLFANQRHASCPTCHKVSRGTIVDPPILQAVSRLPAYLNGEWVSNQCEILPAGNFITRRMIFSPRQHSWALETTLFVDPACSRKIATMYSSGKYLKGDDNDTSIVDGAFDLDLTELCSCVDLSQYQTFRSTFRHNCPKSGCKNVSRLIPTIYRPDLDDEASPLLLLGEGKANDRPTSFQPPLVQCSNFID